MAEKSAKRDRIIEAAKSCFLNYGFEKTSMSDIAKQVNISRTAIYQHFENKEAIFCAIVEQLHQETLAQAAIALTQQQGTITQRILEAFESRMIVLFALVADSIHGDELTDINSRVAAKINRDAIADFTQMLTQAIKTAVSQSEIQLSRLELSSFEAAELLVNSAQGLKQAATSVEDLRGRLKQLIRVFEQATISF
ncbi:MAG: TetR/AcrR family transcriptional regulator [Cyanobacteria bacterium P01_A01_bin.40]